MRSPRYAIAYTPPPSSPLARFGASVLGYDCFERTDVAHLMLHRVEPAMLALATVAPRRCGFQRTLVAPFRLIGSYQNDLVEAFGRFAHGHPPVAVGRLEVAAIGCYAALVPAEPAPRIAELAAACVRYFDRFAAPLTPEEREHRKAKGLTRRQLELLRRWGDPHVFEEFRFHLRLAGPLGKPKPDCSRMLWHAPSRVCRATSSSSTQSR